MAQETLKIGYIDPLSGGGASVGEVGLKTFQFLADEVNAKGGIQGKKVEIVPLDNKTNPQESLIQAQKAIDAGVRYLTQGNGSSVAGALSDFVTKYNERNPGKEVLYFNYAAVDPVLTNDKCSFWHFRWDANSDIKMEALTNYMKTVPSIKNVYLINQDYSFGESVRSAAKAMLAAKRPDIKIVGDETASAAEDHRFRALHRQDQGIRRRHRRDRQLGPGFCAAAEGGRRRRAEGELVHLLCRRHRWPDRDQAGQPQPSGVPGRRRHRQPRSSLVAGISKRRSAPSTTSACSIRAPSTRCGCSRRRPTRPSRSIRSRSRPRSKAWSSKCSTAARAYMRKDDHQFFQPMYISSFGERTEQGAVRRGKDRLGLEARRQDRYAADGACRPPARWNGRTDRSRATFHPPRALRGGCRLSISEAVRRA